MRILDLFCGAGGCSVGYARAGFEVVGVDLYPQPNFPYRFTQGDALEVLGNVARWGWGDFDAIHASPPCQAHSKTRSIQGNTHPELIGPTRELLIATGLPYVIENVPGSPLINPGVLEGQMFEGLRTQRKRWFETNWPLDVPFLRSPRPAPNAKMGRPVKPDEWMHVVGNFSNTGALTGAEAMGIDWMTHYELSQAIPPAYTEFIGAALMHHLTTTRRLP